MDGGAPRRQSGPGDWRGKILQFVREFSRREGHMPSLREIADAVGLTVSTVSYHISAIERDLGDSAW